ncbi:histidine kinase dimerization/phosphoacceptor domain -containing protein [Hymenobacter cavernae]|uniref:histidine kinase n=1 Tax=Hymenobacter cavernae TaxID=2044852 RepID=A0ABQ1TX98_9BACT|nr:histidine kinase dimerization/phosphoacceptor domain -containing protein [Hymenobacter cavernae]GGF04277.1 hypothetical protein GCM10011383_14190 [Hymenobacter cavernae]
MKLLFTIICSFLFLSAGWAQRPADEPAHTAPDFAHLQAAISSLPDTTRIDQLREFTDVMIEKGKFGEAQQALAEAKKVALATKNDYLLSGVYFSIGYLASNQSDHSTAVRNYQQAFDLVKNTPRYKRQARILLALGEAYTITNDWQNAEHYLQQALAIARQHQLSTSMAQVYGDLSNLAGMQQQPVKASGYNQQALAIYRAEKDWQSYYGGLLNQAIIYKNLGQHAQSEKTYQQVLAYAEQQHDDYIKSYIYSNLPNTLLLLKRPAEAEKYAQLGLAAADKGAPDEAYLRRELYDILTRVKEQQHDYQQALAYHRLSAAYRDTMLNEQKSKQLIEAETRYQTKEKQAEITRLDEANAQRVRQLWGLGIGLSVLTLLLALTAWQYQVIRRTNKQLHETNQTILDNNRRITEQSNRLTMLMKELHHRVKNNLAIVSSLLRLQSNRLTDQGAVKAVREGQQRIEAMSLIHQRLYQTDNVTTVDMRRYITDLAESLMTAYGHDPADVDFQIQVEQAVLDVDLAVPLGLILNELLTNSFKYAFAQVARPGLRIYLGPDHIAGGELLLEVQDNGPGIDLAQWNQPSGSFGKRLIASLSEQVGGEMEFLNQQGALYRLHIATAPVLAPTT